MNVQILKGRRKFWGLSTEFKSMNSLHCRLCCKIDNSIRRVGSRPAGVTLNFACLDKIRPCDAAFCWNSATRRGGDAVVSGTLNTAHVRRYESIVNALRASLCVGWQSCRSLWRTKKFSTRPVRPTAPFTAAASSTAWQVCSCRTDRNRPRFLDLLFSANFLDTRAAKTRPTKYQLMKVETRPILTGDSRHRIANKIFLSLNATYFNQ